MIGLDGKELQPNRIEIKARSRDLDKYPVAFGNDLEIWLNGTRLDYWRSVSFDLTHDTFTEVHIDVAVGELFVSADAMVILSAAAEKVTVAGDD